MNSRPRARRAPVNPASIRVAHSLGCLATLQVWDSLNCVWRDRAKVRRADLELARQRIIDGLL